MKVQPGIYNGSLCTLIISEKEVPELGLCGQISVVVSDAQLDLMIHYRNYDFNFDKEGKNTGTGCGASARYKNKGEIVDNCSQFTTKDDKDE